MNLDLVEKDYHLLLDRQPHALNLDAIQYLAGESVLITGAGGSIGSQLARLLATLPSQYAPASITLLESSEYALYQLQEELHTKCPDVGVRYVLGSILDNRLLDCTMRHVSIVFHCAAYKHVPMLEAHPIQGVLTNVLGTYLCAWSAYSRSVKRFMLISTDKAVAPTSVMGATKRVAEMITLSLGLQSRSNFNAVRFGNVLGSSGSVVPKFIRQIQQGQPLTVTHPEMTRYFMTIPEACCLILEAASIDSSSDIFLLDMGEPVKMVELAQTLAALLTGKDTYPIQFTGIRPGEKLHESLHLDGTTPTMLDGILRVNQSPSQLHEFGTPLILLLAAACAGDREHTITKLQLLVPEFTPCG